MDPTIRQAVRQKLAELLREPLERVSNETRLVRLGRYDAAVARELMRRFGVAIPEERLQTHQRVRDLLDVVVEESPGGRPRAVTIPTFAPAPATADRPAHEETAGNPLAARVTTPRPAPSAPAGSFESPTPYEQERIGAAALCCSDGRLGDQTDEFLHQARGLPRYDRICCPGGPVALAGRLMAFWECRGVEDQLRLLVRAHGLRCVVLVAHEGCSYYRDRLGIAPAEAETEQRLDLERAASMIVRMEQGLAVEAYYVRRDGDHVRFEPVPVAGSAQETPHR